MSSGAEGVELHGTEATRFRGICARLNYLAQDRPEIRYSCKEASRRMARPFEGDWSLLKRIGRYLKGTPRVVQRFEWQSESGSLDTFVGSDWAG